jgi:hypothetical protein
LVSTRGPNNNACLKVRTADIPPAFVKFEDLTPTTEALDGSNSGVILDDLHSALKAEAGRAQPDAMSQLSGHRRRVRSVFLTFGFHPWPEQQRMPQSSNRRHSSGICQI